MCSLSVIHSEASECPANEWMLSLPFSADDDAKMASSSGDAVASYDGATEVPPFNNLLCLFVLVLFPTFVGLL